MSSKVVWYSSSELNRSIYGPTGKKAKKEKKAVKDYQVKVNDVLGL